MKYLVMECHLSYAVLLDENGRFVQAANLNYRVGDTVEDIVEMQLPAPKKTWRRVGAAVAACLVLLVGAFSYVELDACASVYLTINPQVRIDVNRRERVVAVAGVNADGVQLTRGYEHGRRDLETVMDELVDRAIDQGYLHEGGKVTLSVDADDRWTTVHAGRLDDGLQAYLKEKISVTIDVEDKSDTPYEDTAYGEGVTDYGGAVQATLPPPPETPKPEAVIPAETPKVQEGDSPYETPEPEDGDSPYETPEPEDGDSPYETPEPEDGDSPYDSEDEEDEYGESDYDD